MELIINTYNSPEHEYESLKELNHDLKVEAWKFRRNEKRPLPFRDNFCSEDVFKYQQNRDAYPIHNNLFNALSALELKLDYWPRIRHTMHRRNICAHECVPENQWDAVVQDYSDAFCLDEEERETLIAGYMHFINI